MIIDANSNGKLPMLKNSRLLDVFIFSNKYIFRRVCYFDWENICEQIIGEKWLWIIGVDLLGKSCQVKKEKPEKITVWMKKINHLQMSETSCL